MMSKTTSIFLVRHGQTDWNISRRVMGKLPIPLNDIGRKQAEAVCQALGEVAVAALYHSPHLRTEETAAAIKGAKACAFTPHSSLREVEYGDWEGKSFEELKAHEAFSVYFTDPGACQVPGGECMREVQERTVACIESLRERHAGETVVLVSHSDVIKTALVHYLTLPLSALHRLCIDNGSISCLLLSPSIDRVVAINRTPELPSLLNRRSA